MQKKNRPRPSRLGVKILASNGLFLVFFFGGLKFQTRLEDSGIYMWFVYKSTESTSNPKLNRQNQLPQSHRGESTPISVYDISISRCLDTNSNQEI